MKTKASPASQVVKKKRSAGKISSEGNSFYVVGLGASAGGLEALEKFLASMPVTSGMAFIIVTHLAPNHVSIMPELLQKSTKMKLFQAKDDMIIEPNHVYVAPANKNLALLNGRIQLMETSEPHGFRLPIDFFFKSLAANFTDKAICIILSGTASDGTAGLKEVKSELGMVMVQDPGSAKFDGMPASAIKTGLVDYILPPEEMPEQLIHYISQKSKGIITDKPLTDAFQKIFSLLKIHTGHDFSLYKQNTISRRVERRMAVSQLSSLSNYIRMIQEDTEESKILFRELLIGVTSFFRDPDSFEKLKKLFADMVKTKSDDDKIRIWIPGCSTGEEAYSIAILLREVLEETKKNINVQIFATDIDGLAIQKARAGSYAGIEPDISKKRLTRFFTYDNHSYSIRKEIREMIVFAEQSIIKDPPFTKLDLISCRNLLIYFNSELQKKLIPLFHFSLQPKGVLFLGSSETIGEFVDLFSILDNKWKLYSRRESVYSSHPFLEFPVVRSLGRTITSPSARNEVMNISQIAERIILHHLPLNCIIANTDGMILYIHGRSGRYLEPAGGEARMNIFEMARDGIKQELPALFRKVIAGKKSASLSEIKVKFNGTSQTINITVNQIKDSASFPDSVLLVIEEVKKVPAAKNPHPGKITQTNIKMLERELKSTKDNLRSTIQELKTSNEELKSANEEMQSTNEEMQSSNEELETSKEELQSLNEELLTLNAELQKKNDEFSVVNNDMKNLLESTNIPTIFLDNNFNIKRFTVHASNVVNLIPTDVGRPINHLATNFKYANFIDDVKEVLRTLAFKEIELQTNDGKWYQMRILPYRTHNNVIDGVVITFLDIDKVKTASEEVNKINGELQLARKYADNVFESVRESLLVLDKEMKVVSANRAFYKMFNTTSQEIIGCTIYDLDDNNWDIPELRKLLEEIIPQSKVFEDYELAYNFRTAGESKLLLNARQILQEDNHRELILLAIQYKNSK